jgi:hypothetical protein
MAGWFLLSHAWDRLARRGCHAQHYCLARSHSSAAVSHRNRSAPQEAIRLSAASLPRQIHVWFRDSRLPAPRLAPQKSPFRKCNPQHLLEIQWGRTASRASGQLFLLRFTFFQQSQKRGTSCRARSAQFSAKRNRKNARGFAASSPLRSCPALLSLGNVVEESTAQLSPFLTDNLS